MEPKLVLFGGTSKYGLLSDGYTVPEIGTNLPAGWHHYRLLPPSCCCLLSCVQLTYFVKSVSVSMSHDLVIYHPILFFSSLDFMGSTWQNREEKSRSQITISFLPLSAVCCSGVTVVRQGAQASGHTKPGFDGANIEGVDHLLAEAPEQLDILNWGLLIPVLIFKVQVLQVLKFSSQCEISPLQNLNWQQRPTYY